MSKTWLKTRERKKDFLLPPILFEEKEKNKIIKSKRIKKKTEPSTLIIYKEYNYLLYNQWEPYFSATKTFESNSINLRDIKRDAYHTTNYILWKRICRFYWGVSTIKKSKTQERKTKRREECLFKTLKSWKEIYVLTIKNQERENICCVMVVKSSLVFEIYKYVHPQKKNRGCRSAREKNYKK